MTKTRVYDKTNYPRWILVNDQGKAYTDDHEITIKSAGKNRDAVCSFLVLFVTKSLATMYAREHGLNEYRSHEITTHKKWRKLLHSVGIAAKTGIPIVLVVHQCDDGGMKSYGMMVVDM